MRLRRHTGVDGAARERWWMGLFVGTLMTYQSAMRLRDDLRMARDLADQQGRQATADALTRRIEAALNQPDRSVVLLAPRVVKDPEILGGSPVLLGTRLPVWLLLARLASGETLETIQEDFPYVTEGDIRDALRVAADLLRGDTE